RRLTLIGTARLDPVVRPDRNVELLLRVAVEITDQRVGVAVLAEVPAFVRAGHTRAALADRLRQWQSAGRLTNPLGTPLRLPQWGPRLLRAADERSARRGACQDAEPHQHRCAHPRRSV